MKPGYKQTDVGVIPEEWETRRLGELLQGPRSIRYGIVQPGKFEPNGCFMLRSQDYSKGWAGPDGMHRVSAQLENQYRNARIRHNDLIITVVGAGIGQVVFAPDWLDGTILSRSTARIAIDQDKAAPSFVQAFLEGPVGKRQILDCQKEGAQPVVSCLDLAKFFLACPPLPEQRAIAEALSDVDGLLGGLDRLIAKKRDIKQAAMQQLLTGQTRLPGFQGEWEVKAIQELSQVGRGRVISHTEISKSYNPVYPVFSSQTSDKGIMGYLDTYDFQGDYVTWTTDGANAGTVFARSGRFNCTNVCGTIKLHDSDHRFIAVALGRVSQSHVSRHLGNPKLMNDVMKKIQITIPKTRAEQTAIAEVLTGMETEIASLEQRREKTRSLKQGMMQELLTGRIRLV